VQLFHAIYAHCCWMPNTLTLHLSTKRYLSVQLFSRWTWVIQISSIFIHFFQVITLGDKWHWFPTPDVIAVTQSTEENTKHSPQQANGLILSPPPPPDLTERAQKPASSFTICMHTSKVWYHKQTNAVVTKNFQRIIFTSLCIGRPLYHPTNARADSTPCKS